MLRPAALMQLAAALLAAPAIAQPLQPPPAFTAADRGNCIACHQVPEGAGPRTRANLGPALDGARMRALGRAGIREIIEDPMRANPDTSMPPFGRHRILSRPEIDRLVEYLHALP